MAVKRAAVASKKAAVKKAPPKRTPAKRTTAKRTVTGDKYACEVCGLTVVVDGGCNCTEGHEILCCNTPMKQKRVLTEAAIALLKKVDSGSVPMYVSDGLTRIAAENGVVVAGTDTPGQVIKALRAIHEVDYAG